MLRRSMAALTYACTVYPDSLHCSTINANILLEAGLPPGWLPFAAAA